jgi:Type IIA topoisomerase (DNA gyrase/topo II, topoisomerase IV), A subunit
MAKDEIEDYEEMQDEQESAVEEDFDGDFGEPVDEDSVSGDELDKYDKILTEGENKYKLSGMYKDWFLDYASYVILDRAVPHIEDGLKPVQRRILHAMKKVDDGRFHKVAGIVGDTMKYHPHGDASIKDALVQLGQKDYMISCQGNWGNIFTGDAAAASRYIEAKLSKFALEVAFNPKITEWVSSYDGTNMEPVCLPMKFPLLLAQGTEGIAVGLAVKILPHNFNELLDACVSALREDPFEIYPDFPTGGLIDCSKYNRGLRGGKVKIRAKIEKVDKRTLSIKEIPFGQTTESLIDSIIKANDKGKIKIKKIDDMSSDSVDINILLQNDVSPDKTIDALYAFTNCEVAISPNACVILDRKPHFMGVDEILKYNAFHTKDLFERELNILLDELEADWHYSSLEKIFFEKKVYRILEKEAESWEEQLQQVEEGMKKYQNLVRREITSDDIAKLVEKPVRKISRFDIKAAEEKIRGIEANIDEVRNNLEHLTDFTIRYFKQLKKKYGAAYPRRTTLATFEQIQAEKAVAINAKLYANKADGFVGIDQKKIENAEYICDCSDIAEIIVFRKDGKYSVTKVQGKAFVGKDIIHAAVFNRKDDRMVYNAIYRDGKQGAYFAKRFSITGITRDKEYDLTRGTAGSSVVYFTGNANGEAEMLKIYFRPRPKLKKTNMEFDFASLAIKGRSSMGNVVTKQNSIQKIVLKAKGVSTLGGKEIWFDTDVNRLNDSGSGLYLGEFSSDDLILVVCKNGTYYTTSYDLSNRYQGDIERIEKFNPKKVYTAVYYDGSVRLFYVKRFSFEPNNNVTGSSFIAEEPGSKFTAICDDRFPQIKVSFKGKSAQKDPETIDVDEFVEKKSLKAKGRRLNNKDVGKVVFIEPLVKDVPDLEDEDVDEEMDPDVAPEVNDAAADQPASVQEQESADDASSEDFPETAADVEEPVNDATEGVYNPDNPFEPTLF